MSYCQGCADSERTKTGLREQLGRAELLMKAAVDGKAAAERRVAAVCSERDELRSQNTELIRMLTLSQQQHLETLKDRNSYQEENTALRERNAELEANSLQQRIAKWADATFGPATAEVSFRRFDEEDAEFTLENQDPEEAADIVVCLMRWAAVRGVDLLAETEKKLSEVYRA